jgi:polysaccharide chain length determinant protein (PEP-CTERM system associated)
MLGVAWIVCVVGWAVVAKMPDQYKASARVYVDTTSVLRPLLQGIAINTDNTGQKIFLMTRTLLSRPNLEKVMRMTDLDLLATNDAERDRVLDELKKKISFSGTSRENLYTIAYEDDSPELAQLIVRSLLTIFMESNLGEVRKDQDSATRFLEQQKEEYERRMRELETELATFKQRNVELLPEGSAGYYERVRERKDLIARLELELSVLNERLETTRKQVEGEVPTFGIGGTQMMDVVADTAEVDQRIRSMQARLDELTLKYTDRHPDVIQAKNAMRDLRSERAAIVAAAEREAAAAGPAYDTSLNQNPVYQQMRLSMATLEADAAAKSRLLEEHKTQLERLESSIDTVLALEAERRDLASEYELAKRNRDVLETRLESVRVGRRADDSADNVRFRVVDPPRVPSEPSGPNRVLFSAAVLLLALGAGFGVAFLMSQFRPTFDERQMLSDTTGLPVLGSVNMVWTSDQVRARRVRNVSFVLTLSGLLLTFGIVLAFYQFNIDLLPRLAESLRLS